MHSPTLEVSGVKLNGSREKINIDVNDFPYPMAIYISSTGEVFLNKLAMECLTLKNNGLVDIMKWWKLNPHLINEFKRRKSDLIINQKVHVNLFDQKNEIMNFCLRLIKNPLLGDIFFISFSKATEKFSACTISSIYSIKSEIAKLKPYLNKVGQSMLENVMKNYFGEEDSQLTLGDMVYYEKELKIIQREFPILSYRETILCGLLVNNMDGNEIANITNRTLSSVFVTIHRIKRKLNVLNKKELIVKLQDVVNQRESEQWVIEEFEL